MRAATMNVELRGMHAEAALIYVSTFDFAMRKSHRRSEAPL